MLLQVISGIVVLIAAILAFAATKPAVFRVQRSINIETSPAKVFALINDFHNWGRWAPQDKEDPTMRRTYAGSPSGNGAISDWDSTGTAGKGRMSIVDSIPDKRIAIKVDFAKPFEAHNNNEFTLEPIGTFTNVTWTMHGTNLYVMKVMSIFTNMDRVVGKHFDKGLANLKTIAEQ
jgi:uncharacterized protein YndB with AHSA1/START domain